MRPSITRSAATDTLPTRSRAAYVAFTAFLLLALFPAAAGAAEDMPSIRSLRAQRTVLIRRLATLTDDATRAEARAAAASERVRSARADAETSRLHVARFAVDAYVDGVQASEADQLRRKGWADVVSETDRFLVGVHRAAKRKAATEEAAAQRAVDEARVAMTQIQLLRTELERTITERVTADAAAAQARRQAMAATTAKVTPRPRYARLTQLQQELFARFPFGPVSGIPAGLVATGQTVVGPASWYGPGFDGRPTASGAIFDQEGPTVASKELPLGTILLISANGRSVLALVNDRGPFVAGRVLDLSHGVAAALGTVQAGVARVTAQVLVPG